LPEETSQGLLQQLRANIDPITLLESVRGSPSSIQPLGQAAARSIIPSVHTELELELMIRHSISYPTLDHSGRDELMSSYSSKFVADLTSTATTDTDGALSTNTEVVLTTGLHHQIGVSSSTRHGKARASNNQSYVQDVEIQYRRKVDALLGTPSRLEGHDRAGTEPQPSYYDQRLEHLDIKFWTTVSVTTQFAASAISIYLVTDHPVFGLFDAELFITDLVECKLNYCCPFLVSSLLAFASVSRIYSVKFRTIDILTMSQRAYTSEDGSAAMKSKEFEKEAEQLWLTNKSEDSILSIAALTLLFGSEGSHGQLVPSLEYLHEMFEMAKRLRLLGVRDSIHDGELALMNKNDQISTSQAAWGAFNCLVWAVQHVNAPMFENLELIEPRCSPSPGFEIQSNIRHYFRYQDTQGG
jgi:hypothetical protein